MNYFLFVLKSHFGHGSVNRIKIPRLTNSVNNELFLDFFFAVLENVCWNWMKNLEKHTRLHMWACKDKIKKARCQKLCNLNFAINTNTKDKKYLFLNRQNKTCL